MYQEISSFLFLRHFFIAFSFSIKFQTKWVKLEFHIIIYLMKINLYSSIDSVILKLFI